MKNIVDAMQMSKTVKDMPSNIPYGKLIFYTGFHKLIDYIPVRAARVDPHLILIQTKPTAQIRS